MDRSSTKVIKKETIQRLLKDVKQILRHPLSCTEFDDRTYMHVNSILSDYVKKHNKEYKEGISVA